MNLPAHPDTERYVLGHALVEPLRLDLLRGSLDSDAFSLDRHRVIWGLICSMYDAGKAIDRITVSEEARAAGKFDVIGGLSYLIDLDTGMPENAAISGYVERLQEAQLRRRMMLAAHHLELLAADEGNPASEVLEGFTSAATELSRGTSGAKRPISTLELMNTVGLDTLLNPRRQMGITLPWAKLSEDLSGLSPGQMIVLMAATSRGKTSLALQIATGAATQGFPPVIWTMEMSPNSLFKRMVAQISGNRATVRQTTFEQREQQRLAVAQLGDYPLYFDGFSRSVASFAASCRQVRATGKVGLAVVDYLQLIRGSGKNRSQEVSDNSRALKLAAMDLGIPFVVLSQVDRGSVKGEGKIGLHSGKESGDIENDADVVLWIEAGELSRDAPTPVSVHVGKQREGPAGFSVPMMFSPESQTFQEVSSYAE